MGKRPGGAGRLAPLGMVVLAAIAATASAQETPRERPPTGRHAPPPVAVTAPAPRPQGEWSWQVGGGLLTSGDLFRVIVPDGTPRNWQAPGGGRFTSSEYLVTLDEDLLFALAVGRRLSGRWTARLDLSWAEVDATAEARVAQSVELYLWDRVAFLSGALGLECRLVRGARAFPYALAGVGVVRLDARGMAALDQTLLAPRLGFGFHLELAPGLVVRAELRDTVRQFSLGDYGAEPDFAGQTFEERGPQHLFDLLLAVRAGL